MAVSKDLEHYVRKDTTDLCNKLGIKNIREGKWHAKYR